LLDKCLATLVSRRKELSAIRSRKRKSKYMVCC